MQPDPELDRLLNQILDDLFGPDPPGKKPEPMSDREFEALIDRIAANGYKPFA